MVIDEVSKAYVRDLLKKDRRPDGRRLLDHRQIVVEKGFIPNAEGSAKVSLGETKVVAGVKFDLAEPFADSPGEGVISFNSEFSPMAHPEFEPGPPNERSIELARVVDRGIRSGEVVDLQGLAKHGSVEGKVLGLYVDLYILDQCGNLIDCAALAAMAALADTKIPRVEGEKIIRDEFVGGLPLARKVVCCSFEKIDGKFIFDATYEEETASDGRLSLSTSSDGLVCASQKSGAAGFSRSEVLQLIDASFEKSRELLEHV